MPTVTIDGKDYNVTGLSPAQRNMWEVFLGKLHAKTYWLELHENIKALPVRLQDVIVSRSYPAETIRRWRYFDLATRVGSVEYLVNMTCLADRPEVTEGNAAEVYMALEPLVLDKPVTFSGGAALAKLQGGDGAER